MKSKKVMHKEYPILGYRVYKKTKKYYAKKILMTKNYLNEKKPTIRKHTLNSVFICALEIGLRDLMNDR